MSVFTGTDQGTVLLGVVLLVVPVVVLASAAGRLGAARRAPFDVRRFSAVSS